MTARGLAGVAVAVGLGITAAVVPAPQSVEVAPARVEAAGYGTVALEPRVRVPAVAEVERRTAQAPRWSVDWDLLAACESGEWVNGGESFVPGTARWDDRSLHRGGLQFAVGTWAAYRDPSMPADAADATPTQQMQVAERVLAAQGLGAWPRCSVLTGLR